MAAQEILSPEADTEQENVSQATLDASTGFIGEWHTLVSTTNWDKGRIICEWRESLKASGAPVSQYSDEAWAQIVGDVTGQHVGRLRRTSERFGGAAPEYAGLYWSHFQTALDWEDAEMWLEGALQNGWSVSQMRAKRWETVDGGQGEDSGDSADDDTPSDAASLPSAVGSADEENAAIDAEIHNGDDASESSESTGDRDPADPEARIDAPSAERREPVRPMKDLSELPDDLAEAFEQFKLAILTHKMTGWTEISRDEVIASLAALEQLALAPSGE